MEWIIAMVTIAVALVLVWLFFRGRNPSQGEGDARPRDDTLSDRLYSGADRPAGPDAEEMGPDPATPDPAGLRASPRVSPPVEDQR